LKHERALTDVAELRQILDGAAGNARRAKDTIDFVRAEVQAGRGTAPVADEFKQRVGEVTDGINVAQQRLQLRLGTTDLSTRFDDLGAAIKDLTEAVAAEQGAFDEADKKWRTALSRFFAAGNALVGARLDPASGAEAEK